MTNKTRTLDELNEAKDEIFKGYWETLAREKRETQANIDRLRAAAKTSKTTIPASENNPYHTVSQTKKL